VTYIFVRAYVGDVLVCSLTRCTAKLSTCTVWLRGGGEQLQNLIAIMGYSLLLSQNSWSDLTGRNAARASCEAASHT
jgi:hypothetical protein